MDAESRSESVRCDVPPAGHEDRRSAARYAVVEEESRLGWWEGPSFVTTRGRTLDLSIRGALLEVENLPGAESTVWFCPPGATPGDWLEAAPVQSVELPDGRRELRIAFRRILPYATFKTLVYGRPGLEAPGEVPPVAANTTAPDAR
jgi:hypothetical protein